ncbi:hypothetical protein BU24DRAFT_84451 [Aaosphaeria arxii CBS 175.79]|uniref:Rhodopsin domain-containing protein n=1 Tax=Aaosphaeria arxii CBS 175.79 TaxID=1450172 RepID=A0A6A5X8W9_9PLEO|nr:uncharacterized protein BU24DRAFT_84451 [Aaosphaeria arxii CBS 175.79]KAF2009204.1 hypothetical protein BU24DRAFT_84451 [Aaosphaeria arxii CBS 175.79]
MAGHGTYPLNVELSQRYLDEDNSAPLLATCITFFTIESIFIAFLYVSRYLSKDQKANMWMTLLMTAGFISCCGKITLGILAVEIGGAGRHMAYLHRSHPEQISNLLKIQTALQIVCPLTTSLTKLGILSLLHQILGRTSQRTSLIIKITFGLSLAIAIVQVIIPFANCKPFSKTWTSMGSGECLVSGLDLWRYLSIPNVVTTIIMICIPLPVLYKLKVNLSTKLGLGLVFAVCIVGVVAAIMRFHSFLQVKNFNDISYEIIAPLCWTVAESGIYLMAGVLPTMRPLARKVFRDTRFERLLSRSFGRTTGSWGNRRASRFVGKPLPGSQPVGTDDLTTTSELECGKFSDGRFSDDGSEHGYENRVRPMGKI